MISPAEHAPSVILAEGDRGMRAALVQALTSTGADVTAAVETGEALLALVEHVPADVVLVDLDLPGISGAEVIRRLREREPELPILVVSVVQEAAAVVEAIEAGASGYLLKEDAARRLGEALADVRAGRAPVSPEVARHVLARVRALALRAPQRQRLLSDRELSVLELLSRGQSYAAVADALEIQHGTVQSHVKNIYRKLEVSSKAEAATIAHRDGLLPRRT
jgi:DNA-binding NarL/FixJ family response regulator